MPAATALPDTSPEECHELCAHVELATPAEIVLHPESSLADIAEDRDCSESVVASLQAQVLSLQAERDDLADTLSKMKSSWTPTSALQDAQKRIASLEQAAVQHHAQLEKAAAESRERVASEAKLSAALSALQRKYADAVADVPLAAAAKAALESQLAELRSANSALHHSLEHAQSKLSSTSEREHELAQQTAAYRALQESFTKLQRSFDKMQSDFRVSVGRESEIERQLEQARSGRDDKLAELQTNVAQVSSHFCCVFVSISAATHLRCLH